ncbi:MAG TPA: phasin family protein [Burkholderiales bacterium]|nr:phasin family protein [Burkholderiales bacterium]
MFNVPEQFVAAKKANLETAVGLTTVALEGAGHLIDLQLTTAKAALAEGTKYAKALLDAKDAQEVIALQSTVVEPGFEKALAYSRSVYEVASQTQAEITKLVEARVADFNKIVVAALDKAVKTAPAGSDVAVAAVKSAMAAANSAYDTISKAAKQVAELTEASVAAATTQAVNASKKKAA